MPCNNSVLVSTKSFLVLTSLLMDNSEIGAFSIFANMGCRRTEAVPSITFSDMPLNIAWTSSHLRSLRSVSRLVEQSFWSGTLIVCAKGALIGPAFH